LPDLIDSHNPELLNADEQAARLGVSRKKLYRLAAEHGLPVTRIGRSVYFRPSLVAAWLDEHTTGARPFSSGRAHDLHRDELGGAYG
jgi:excisionase family DNA binding protein